MAEFWAKREGQVAEYGPFTADQLKDLAARKKIGRRTLVRRGDSTAWHRAESVRGLFQEIPILAPPPPPDTHIVQAPRALVTHEFPPQPPVPQTIVVQPHVATQVNVVASRENVTGLIGFLIACCGLLCAPVGLISLIICAVAMTNPPRTLAIIGFCLSLFDLALMAVALMFF